MNATRWPVFALFLFLNGCELGPELGESDWADASVEDEFAANEDGLEPDEWSESALSVIAEPVEPGGDDAGGGTGKYISKRVLALCDAEAVHYGAGPSPALLPPSVSAAATKSS